MAPSQPENAPAPPAYTEHGQSPQEEMQEIALQPMSSQPMSKCPFQYRKVDAAQLRWYLELTRSQILSAPTRSRK
ncbi:hypothetical protein F4808DRAFT_426863 [Astrocystis sublimbata]|nr:hypothetical protein F4808DRAFT_426863 [Astrocystis sublimbata]